MVCPIRATDLFFLIRKSNELVEIDSKDAKFNETFADYRAQQGKLTKAPYIDPDLKEEKGNTPTVDFINENSSEDDDNKDEQQQTNEHEHLRDGREKRIVTPRTFLHPGTGTKSKDLHVRQQQYLHLCLDNLMEDNREAILLLDCMEAQLDEDTKVMKEMELLTACTLIDEPNEIVTPAITNTNGINLSIPDPKSQAEIDRMDPKDALRFNNATIAESEWNERQECLCLFDD